jgi:hypothetical protein
MFRPKTKIFDCVTHGISKSALRDPSAPNLLRPSTIDVIPFRLLGLPIAH